VNIERIFKVFLRLSGVMLLLAAGAVVMPREWMAAINDRAELPPLPAGPLVEYLARSASALYAMFGATMWIMAGDVQRYRPLLLFHGWASLVFGATMLAIDWHVGMPLPWRCCEGPSIIVMGAVMLGFLWKIRASGQ
jgi:hypothetical protein